MTASQPDTETTCMVDVTDVTFAYEQGDFELAIDRFHVSPGERVAIVGPSGSGKTTLLSLLAGIYLPRTGSITVAGNALTNLSAAARRRLRLSQMGLVFQEFELIEYLSVRDNILLPFRLETRMPLSAAVRRRADWLAQQLHIGDKQPRYPHQLSQGERQRAAICRALIANPQLVLADEPTGNLDPVNKTLVLDLLLEMTRESNCALIAVTHDHGLLERFDRVIDFNSFLPTTA